MAPSSFPIPASPPMVAERLHDIRPATEDRPRRPSSGRRSLCAVIVIVSMALVPVAAGRADVVPPRAVEVAEAWLALVDRGRHDAAMRAYFDPRAVRAADALRTGWRAGGAAVGRRAAVTRTIRSWTGHGDGDSSRTGPGAWFSLVFDTRAPGEPPGTDEVRVVPSGDDWKVVDYLTDRGALPNAPGSRPSGTRQLR